MGRNLEKPDGTKDMMVELFTPDERARHANEVLRRPDRPNWTKERMTIREPWKGKIPKRMVVSAKQEIYWRRLPEGMGGSCYITGGAALNLEDPESGESGGTADWHGRESWITHEYGQLVENVGPNGTYKSPWRTIGRKGIRDATREARRIGYPVMEGKQVYVASHVRAILDMAFTRWTRPDIGRPIPIAREMVSDWIWTPKQMTELKRWIAASAGETPKERRDTWIRWGEDLMFGASHWDYREYDIGQGRKVWDGLP